MTWKNPSWMATLIIALAMGCNQGTDEPLGNDEAVDNDEAVAENEEEEHEEWWCVEHGVPEEECGRCSTTLAAEFQDNGDWCEEHNRPDSQCFVCHPELEEQFAALYVAKYGEQPPKPTE